MKNKKNTLNDYYIIFFKVKIYKLCMIYYMIDLGLFINIMHLKHKNIIYYK